LILKQAFFGENSIAMKAESVAQRRALLQE
jgi:hypothetical protein